MSLYACVLYDTRHVRKKTGQWRHFMFLKHSSLLLISSLKVNVALAGQGVSIATNAKHDRSAILNMKLLINLE